MSYPTLFSIEEAQQIRSRNENGEFMWAIARDLDVSVETIKRCITRAGGTPVKHKQLGGKATISIELQKQIAREYESGDTILGLCRKHNLGTKTIRNAIIREGVEFRTTGYGPRQFSESEKDAMVEEYLKGTSSTEVAKNLGTSQSKVSKVLRERNVEIRTTRTDLMNKEWVQRRRLTGPGGYVKIKVHQDDPLYPGTGDAGYMLEHRYVMSQHLGRALERDETVHHIDGDRQNNNIDNLQLRKGQHGTGQVRVCGNCGSHNILHEKL